MTRKRWDQDERGQGVASGAAFTANLGELARLMADPGWVAEEPEAHLLPHLEAACRDTASVFRIDRAWSDDEVFVVDLTPREADLSIGQLRHAAVTLAASIAEESTHVLQRRVGEVLEFEIATGTSPADASFASHGHLVRLRVHRAAG